MEKALCLLIWLIAWLPDQAQTVYKTPSGKKYHIATCRSVKNMSEEISLEEALKAGLERCKICKAKLAKAYATPLQKVQRTTTGVQCKGLTKSGSRCNTLLNRKRILFSASANAMIYVIVLDHSTLNI